MKNAELDQGEDLPALAPPEEQSQSLYARIKQAKDKFPCGAVVGILKRAEKTHFCVALDRNFREVIKGPDGVAYTRALAIPYDNRLPRVLILTRKVKPTLMTTVRAASGQPTDRVHGQLAGVEQVPSRTLRKADR